MKEKELIKKAKPFGKYNTHIIMKGEEINKKFIVLPIKYKYVLEKLLKVINKQLKKTLCEILTSREIIVIRESVQEEIKKYENNKNLTENILKKGYKDYYKGIEEVDEIQDLKNINSILSKKPGKNERIINKIREQIDLIK